MLISYSFSNFQLWYPQYHVVNLLGYEMRLESNFLKIVPVQVCNISRNVLRKIYVSAIIVCYDEIKMGVQQNVLENLNRGKSRRRHSGWHPKKERGRRRQHMI